MSSFVQTRRHILDFHPSNKDAMDVVEKALFSVCLERVNAESLHDRAHSALLGTGKECFQLV